MASFLKITGKKFGYDQGDQVHKCPIRDHYIHADHILSISEASVGCVTMTMRDNFIVIPQLNAPIEVWLMALSDAKDGLLRRGFCEVFEVKLDKENEKHKVVRKVIDSKA